MSYGILRGLYLGEASNADLASADVRARLHVTTPLDELIPSLVQRRLDVVLTGNPGDGKSHLVRNLAETGRLAGATIELDLSAHPDEEIIAAWEAAARAGHPFVLCANQGPLITLLETLASGSSLHGRAAELGGQLGRLLTPRPEHLPPAPRAAASCTP